MTNQSDPLEQRQISRRNFLRLSAMTTAGAVLVACAPAVTPSPGAQQGAAAPAASKVSIVATTQMTITQWEEATKRAVDQLPNIDLKITQTNIS